MGGTPRSATASWGCWCCACCGAGRTRSLLCPAISSRGNAGPRGSDVPPAQVRLSVRDQAERMWPISAERPIVGKGGPLKSVLRRLMRWYVEPAFADQRAFNDAVLKLVDDLDERIARLENR